jgi:hypothetical protein
MRRRHRPFTRFVPRLETLERRNLLSNLPVAPPLPQAAPGGPPAFYDGDPDRPIAVGTTNGQLAVLGVVNDVPGSAGVVTGRRQYKPVEVDIYNYSLSGGFTTAAPLPTQVPASPEVRLAFGDLNNDGRPDLVVAGPDGHGSVVVELFASSRAADGTWTFQPVMNGDGTAHTDTIDILSWSFGVSQPGVALTDVNADGTVDVVLSTNTQVAGLVVNPPGSGTTGNTYTALPAVGSPFLPYLPGGPASAGIQDHKNISDGAAKGQAVDGIIQNDDGGYDLVTEADGQFLFAQMNLSSTGVTFAYVPGTQTKVESLAIMPNGGTSTPQPLTSPLKGHEPAASQMLATGIICITYPCPGQPTVGPALAAVIGNKLYVGTGSTTGFTWSVEPMLTTRKAGRDQQLFLADLDNGADGTDAELFSVVLQPGPQVGSPPSAAIDILLEIDGID